MSGGCQGAARAAGEGCWQRRGIVSDPHLTPSSPKENRPHPHSSTCPSPLPAPCSCPVWLGRQTGGAPQRKRHTTRKEARRRAQCERRPGGHLGELRVAEQACRDPSELPGLPSLSAPLTSILTPVPPPAPGALPPSVPSSTPLGPALSSCPDSVFPRCVAPDGAALPVTALRSLSMVPPASSPPSFLGTLPGLGRAGLPALISPARCPSSPTVLQHCLPYSICSSHGAGGGSHGLCGPKRELASAPISDPIPSTVPMSPRFYRFLGIQGLNLFLLPQQRKGRHKCPFN